MPVRADSWGLVLAGGLARRMGGGDKGLLPLAGRSMPYADAVVRSPAVRLIASLAVGASVISPDLVFAYLVNATGAVMIFVYMGVVISQLILRPKTPPERLHIRTWLYPWSGYLTIAVMLAVLVAMAMKPSSAIELASSVACLLVAVACYFLFRFRRRASG